MTKQPSKAARQAVPDAFDPDALKRLCVEHDFSAYADRYALDPSLTGRERFYWYRDSDSPILAVAHLDTVQDDRTCQITSTASGLLATSGGLDDRLGVYVICELLPALGIHTDILLTTDEEIGQSTSEDFTTDKPYNWLFQFDRGGSDVVAYDYETPELCTRIEQAGARVGQGSFSDICNLEHLGCQGVNWGVGYQDYHSARSHAWLDDTFRMVARFVKFYNANAETFLPHQAYNWRNPLPAESYEIQADCGHMVDLDDPSSYIELPDKTFSFVCSDCGAI